MARATDEVTVSLVDDSGEEQKIVINLSADALDTLKDLAEKRGIDLDEMIIEALRLEQLLADRRLFMRTKTGGVQELVAV